MAAIFQLKLTKFFRGIGVRQIRLACGLVLFAYLVSHFLNHALGNISMDALAAGGYYHIAFWQFLPVAIAFYAAALVHSRLGICALYARREFPSTAIRADEASLTAIASNGGRRISRPAGSARRPNKPY